MIFTNKRSYVPTTKAMTFTNQNTNIMKIRTYHMPNNVSVVTQKSYVEKVAEKHDQKKIKWGEPFWNLFHILAEKVKESEFSKIRVSLLNLIYTICSNLPCPDCTNHAMHYLNGLNFNNIKTKDNLKDMLFNFHNAVNARKGFPIFPKCDLDPRYSQGNVIIAIEIFLKHYKMRYGSIRMIADDMHRDRLSKKFIEWFRENMKFFD